MQRSIFRAGVAVVSGLIDLEQVVHSAFLCQKFFVGLPLLVGNGAAVLAAVFQPQALLLRTAVSKSGLCQSRVSISMLVKVQSTG